MEGPLWIINSILLGAGLAMDAFSVSLANGLHEPHMNLRRMGLIAGVFGGFQALMPLIGWVLIHSLMSILQTSQTLISLISLVLLCAIGGKMIMEGFRFREGSVKASVTVGALIMQGIATSLDALSVGFTLSGLHAMRAVSAALIIGAVTFIICMAGLFIGRKAGTWIGGKASVIGGIILIVIGIEIFFVH